MFYYWILILFLLPFSFSLFAAFTPKQLKEIEESLKFGVPDERKRVLKQIQDEKDPQSYELIKNLIKNDLDPEILNIAVQIIGDFQITGVEEDLENILENIENNILKANIIKAFGKLKYQKISKKVIEALDSDVKEIKIAALFTAGEIQEKKALDKIYEILDKMDEKEEILQEAIQAIGKIGDKKSIPKLKEILENPGYSKYIRMLIPISLAKIGGKESVDILKKALQDPEYVIRIRAVYALSELGTEEIAQFKKNIQAALKDSDAKVRATALEVVGKSGDRDYLPFLFFMMEKDPDAKTRKKAVQVYSQLDSKGSVAVFFKEKLKSGDFHLKRYILEAMKEMETDTITGILEEIFFETDNFDLRQGIIGVLSEKIKDQSAYVLLKKIAGTKNLKGFYDSVNKIRMAAIQALAKTGWEGAFLTYQYIGEDFSDPLQIQTLALIPSLDREKAQEYFLNHLANMSGKSHAFRYQIVRSLFQLRPVGIEDKLKAAFFKETDVSIRNFIGKVLRSYGVDNEALENEYQKLKTKK